MAAALIIDIEHRHRYEIPSGLTTSDMHHKLSQLSQIPALKYKKPLFDWWENIRFTPTFVDRRGHIHGPPLLVSGTYLVYVINAIQ